jgi:phosphinothricin acetyltransferase
VTLRAAGAADAEAIAALWNAMIRDTLATFTTVEKSAQDVAALLTVRPGFWVADDGAVQGFVTYGAFRAGPGYAATVEHSIVLTPAARGRGLGRALMQTAIDHAAAQGHHVMVGAISGANPGAVAFHEKLGFTTVGRMPEVGRKAGLWLDLIWMQKLLDRP